MKCLLIISAMFLTFQAHAEIFKCKEVNGKISYQGTPCLTGTASKINKPPEVPIDEQIRANTKLNNTKEMNRQHEAARKLEHQQQEESAKKEEASEMDNRQVEAVEQQTVILEDSRQRSGTLPARRPATLPARAAGRR